MTALIYDALKKNMFTVGFLIVHVHKTLILQLLLFICSLGYGFHTQRCRFQSQIKLLLRCISYPSRGEMSPIYLTVKSWPENRLITASFLSHLFQKCFNADHVPFCDFDACNLNIKQFCFRYIITALHPASCVTRLSSPSCVGWMKSAAVRALVGWRGASTDI